MNIDINDTKSELGEGVYWSADQEILYWLDINNAMLFSRKEDTTFSYHLIEKASSILDVDGCNIYLASESGILCFIVKSNKTLRISKIPLQYSSNEYRANDGIILSKNLYMYGL